MSIGKRLKTRRQELAMTLDDVAQKIKRTSPTVQRYESGEIDIPHSVIEKLAHLYSVTPNWLMEWNGEPSADEWRLLSVLRANPDVSFVCFKIITLPKDKLLVLKSVLETFN